MSESRVEPLLAALNRGVARPGLLLFLADSMHTHVSVSRSLPGSEKLKEYKGLRIKPFHVKLEEKMERNRALTPNEELFDFGAPILVRIQQRKANFGFILKRKGYRILTTSIYFKLKEGTRENRALTPTQPLLAKERLYRGVKWFISHIFNAYLRAAEFV